MGRKVIKCTLDEHDIDRAIKELRQYKREFRKKFPVIIFHKRNKIKSFENFGRIVAFVGCLWYNPPKKRTQEGILW